jgi:hypothetical protein
LVCRGRGELGFDGLDKLVLGYRYYERIHSISDPSAPV